MINDTYIPSAILWVHICLYLQCEGHIYTISSTIGVYVYPSMTKGIYIPFIIVRAYICPFSTLTKKKDEKLSIFNQIITIVAPNYFLEERTIFGVFWNKTVI